MIQQEKVRNSLSSLTQLLAHDTKTILQHTMEGHGV